MKKVQKYLSEEVYNSLTKYSLEDTARKIREAVTKFMEGAPHFIISTFPQYALVVLESGEIKKVMVKTNIMNEFIVEETETLQVMAEDSENDEFVVLRERSLLKKAGEFLTSSDTKNGNEMIKEAMRNAVDASFNKIITRKIATILRESNFIKSCEKDKFKVESTNWKRVKQCEGIQIKSLSTCKRALEDASLVDDHPNIHEFRTLRFLVKSLKDGDIDQGSELFENLVKYVKHLAIFVQYHS